MEPFTGEGRDITMDNLFTPLELAKILQAKNTILPGRIDRNRRELSDVLKIILHCLLVQM